MLIERELTESLPLEIGFSLRLQPYRQQSLIARKNLKLSPRFYGPYQILERMGEVAYKLDLPASFNLHPIFHVSLLKKHVGQHISPLTTLPPIDYHGQTLPQA